MATKVDMTLSDDDPIQEDDLPPATEKGVESDEREKTSLRVWRYPIALYRFLAGKPAFLATAALLIGAAAAWGFLENTAQKRAGDARFRSLHGVLSSTESLIQEEMSRFYIPMPKESGNLVMTVDFSVVWDAISAVRFKKAEVSIRNRLYDSLTSLAAKEEGLNENTSAVEESISRILRETLAAESLSVRVKEVKLH
ncbi:MAG: hypothetical protein C4576_06545 [Desulfobacteraceae bacterium]|nr:MAG: hypothetical protein C4576_06545 [Desulfobacteraceae bacterium]